MSPKLSTLLLAPALFTASMAGQGRSGAPHDAQTMIKMRVAMLTSMLSLTEAQQVQATTIFTEAITASDSVRTSLQTNSESLSSAIRKNDIAAIDTLAAAAGVLNGQLTAIQSKAEAAFYAILTADQQSKYDSMPGRGFGGPGVPGGFGGPGMMPRRPQ